MLDVGWRGNVLCTVPYVDHFHFEDRRAMRLSVLSRVLCD